MNENITTLQKYEKDYLNAKNTRNRKNMKNTKYVGRGGKLGKPQLHWLFLLLRLHPLKTVQFQTLTPSLNYSGLTYLDMMVLMMTKNQDVLSPDIFLKLLLSTGNQHYSGRCSACYTDIVQRRNIPWYVNLVILYTQLNRMWGVEVKNR